MPKNFSSFHIRLVYQSLIIILFGLANIHAQEIRMATKSKFVADAPESAFQSILVKSADTSNIGHVLRINDSIIVSLPNKSPIKLPLRLPYLISYDGSTIIQFGDMMMLDEPQKLDVFWIDDKGEVKNRMVNKYAGDARLNISEDGYLAIGGLTLDSSALELITCYSPDGNKIWETSLTKGRRISQLYPARNGDHVIAVTTDSENWLVKHQLVVFDNNGELKSTVQDLGIIQRVVLLGDDSKLFFQGKEMHGVIEVSSGNVTWKKTGKVAMVSPEGAALSPNGNFLYLAVIEAEGRRTGTYKWNFMVLNSSSGDKIRSYLLPDKYPATWERIYIVVSDTGINLRAGEDNYKLSLEY